jgi:flagellar protein FlaG
MNIQPTGSSLPPQSNPAASSAPREPRPSTDVAAKPADTAHLAPTPAATPPDRQAVEAAAKSVREFVAPINSNLEFSVNEDTGQLVVKIVDRSTKEVIRQMPSAEMLAIAKALDSIKGLFVKQSA